MKTIIYATLVALALPATASASSGVITGHVMFYQNQGNYCDVATQNCAGARYLSTERGTYQPVRNTVLALIDDPSGVPIGFGVSDSNGSFTMSWFAASASPKAKLVWTGRHKDGRFFFLGPAGGTYQFKSKQISLVANTSPASPQSVGSRKWGNANNPLRLFNAYDGAERLWRTTLSRSNAMLATFFDVEIRAFSDTQPSNCKTSCADGSNKLIQLSTDAPFAPQARVMHEMGHVASYLANPRAIGNDYCWPDTGGVCGWSAGTPEWQAAAFEEALATYFADTALWSASSEAPRSCLSNGACIGVGAMLELSQGPIGGGSCLPNEDRFPRSSERYLWDIFDNHPDPGMNDDISRPVYEVVDTIGSYPFGFFDHQSMESALNLDGNSAFDFMWNYWTETNVQINTFNLLNGNCSPLF